MRLDIRAVRLCVLVADGVSKLPFETLLGEILAGGADSIQLREKSVSDRVLLMHGRACRRACDDYALANPAEPRRIFIVNDRADIAALSGADGVHVGQDDVGAAEARRIAGEGAIVGVSTSESAEIAAAEAAGADYLGVGAVFPTATKAAKLRGLEFVRHAAGAATRHFLAIGGIDHSNVGEVIRAGAPGVAVFSAVIAAEDPRAATRDLKDFIAAAIAGRGKA